MERPICLTTTVVGAPRATKRGDGAITKLARATLLSIVGGFGAHASSAQSMWIDPSLLREPASFEDCLAQRENLLEAAKAAGDEAWELVDQLPGMQATSQAIRALYEKAEELSELASELDCWRRFPPQNELDAIHRAFSHLRDRTLQGQPQLVRDLIEDRLDEVMDHNLQMEGHLAAAERAIREFDVGSTPTRTDANQAGIGSGPASGSPTQAVSGSEEDFEQSLRTIEGNDVDVVLEYPGRVSRSLGQLRFILEGLPDDVLESETASQLESRMTGAELFLKLDYVDDYGYEATEHFAWIQLEPNHCLITDSTTNDYTFATGGWHGVGPSSIRFGFTYFDEANSP